VLFKGRVIFSQSLLKMYAYKDLQIEFFWWRLHIF
jgi:hypothetical protein